MLFKPLSVPLAMLLAVLLLSIVGVKSCYDEDVQSYRGWKGEEEIKISFEQLELFVDVAAHLGNCKTLSIDLADTWESYKEAERVEALSILLYQLGRRLSLTTLVLSSPRGFIRLELGNALQTFDDLKTLRLEKVYLPDEVLAPLTGLEFLKLKRNGKIPQARLPNLHTLTLQEMSWVELPLTLDHLPNLTRLSIEDSSVEHIERVGLYRQVRFLSLSDSQFSRDLLSEELLSYESSFSQVRHLELRNMDLTEVPLWLAVLPNLQRLDLSYNQLRTGWSNLEPLIHLEWLSLRGNNLQARPKVLETLPQLKSIDLDLIGG